MKKKKIPYLILLFVCAITFFATAQQNNPISQYSVNIVNPQTASLMKDVNYPVNMYNGTIDISVPIYVVKDGAIEIPLALSYNSSGIRVAEEASWVGLGWNLGVGGAIVHQPVGELDDSELSHDYNNFINAPYNLFSFPLGRYTGISYTASQPTRDNYELLMHTTETDQCKPDIYSFNFGGHSGRFYINKLKQDKIFQINPKEDIKFESFISSVDNIRRWKATLEDGTSYFFGIQTQMNPYSKERTFLLSEIHYPNGQIVSYSYTLPGYRKDVSTPYESVVTTTSARKKYYSVDCTRSEVYILNKISTTNFDITFNTSSREDIDVETKLDNFVVTDKLTNTSRIFDFNYDYFISTNYSAGSYHNLGFFNLARAIRRLRLLSVGERGLPTTKFEYNKTLLPIKASYAVDYWGYYNGQTKNTTFLPNLKYLAGNYSSLPEEFKTGYACRASDPESSIASMLQSITSPTGGVTKFQFEANTFSFNNQFYPTVKWIQENDVILGNITPLSCSDYNTSANRAINFSLLKTSSIKISCYISRGTNSWSNMIGSSVSLNRSTSCLMKYEVVDLTTVKLTTASGVKYFTIDQNSQSVTCDFISEFTQGDYYVISSLADGIGDQSGYSSTHANVSASTYIPSQTTEQTPKISHGAGVRIASIKKFNDINALTPSSTIYYKYEDNSTQLSNGLLMTPPSYFKIYYSVKYISGTPSLCANVNPKCETSDEDWDELEVRSSSAIPISSCALGGLVGYSKVTQYFESSGNSTYPWGRLDTYFFNSLPASNSMGAPEIVLVKQGLKSREEYYDSSNSLVKTDKYDFQSMSFDNYFGVYLDDYWCRHLDLRQDLMSQYPSCCTGMLLLTPWDFNGRFSGLAYPIVSEKSLLTYVETIWANGLVETIVNGYNSVGQQTTKTTYNSKDNVPTTSVNEYPSTYSGSDPVINALCDNHIWSSPLSLIVLKNGSVLYRENYEYKKTGSILNCSPTGNCDGLEDPIYNLSKKSIAETGGSYNTILNFEYYKNNLSALSKSNDITTSYLWGYNNTLPIAKIENTQVSQVAYTSFEEGVTAGWDVGANLITNVGSSICGRKNCALSGATIQSPIMQPGTYWVDLQVSSMSAGKLSINGSSPYSTSNTKASLRVQYTLTVAGKISFSGDAGTGMFIDEVRIYPVDAQMTTYTYSPLVGMTSQTDPNGTTNFYEYDSFGRLLRIKDNDGKILKEMEYNYAH